MSTEFPQWASCAEMPGNTTLFIHLLNLTEAAQKSKVCVSVHNALNEVREKGVQYIFKGIHFPCLLCDFCICAFLEEAQFVLYFMSSTAVVNA